MAADAVAKSAMQGDIKVQCKEIYMSIQSAQNKVHGFNAEPLCDLIGILVTPSTSNNILELDVNAIIEHIKMSGAVMFKGFNADAALFEKFSNSFSNDFMNNVGSGSWRKTKNYSSDGTVQNVAYTYGIGHQRTFPLPLHADRAYVKSRPEVMFFMCEIPAAQDGQTTVCDGIDVYNGLSETTRKLLDEKRIKYIRHYEDGEWQTLYQTHDFSQIEKYCADNDMYLERRDDNSIYTEYVHTGVPLTKWQNVKSFCNSVQIGLWQEYGMGRKTTFVRFEDDTEIPEDIRKEFDEVSEALTAEIPWQAGDIAIVDNTRMLHGRRSFTDENRAILTRMCRSVTW